jgi:hypothetical protein
LSLSLSISLSLYLSLSVCICACVKHLQSTTVAGCQSIISDLDMILLSVDFAPGMMRSRWRVPSGKRANQEDKGRRVAHLSSDQLLLVDYHGGLIYILYLVYWCFLGTMNYELWPIQENPINQSTSNYIEGWQRVSNTADGKPTRKGLFHPFSDSEGVIQNLPRSRTINM